MKKIIRFLVLPAMAAVFLLTFITSSIKAFANDLPNVNETLTYERGDFDSYTDNHQLLDDDENTIFTYKDNLWQSTVVLNNDLSKITVSEANDPIIKIVPREFFIHRGTYFYIGEEYAFFAKTTQLNTFSNEIDIFIIDIERTYDIENISTPSQVVHTVKPIFQAKYLYLTNQDNFSLTDFTIVNNSGKSSVIIPCPMFLMITQLNHRIYNFTELNKYFIKDPKFAAVLENEQHLNKGDQGYDPIEDQGSFFIRNDIYYKGVGSQDLGDIVVDTLFVLGLFAKAIPVVGPIIGTGLDIIGNVLDGIDLITDIAAQYRTTTEHGNNFTSASFGSAYEQARHKGLVKLSYGALSSSNSNPLLIGKTSQDNYATCIFTLGQSENWYTRINSNISMSIVTNNFIEGTRHVITETGYYTANLRDIEYKEVEFEDEVDGYFLAGGKDYFEYQSPYSGAFNLSTIENGLTIDVYDSNQNKISENNTGNINLLFQSQEIYLIQISKATNNNTPFRLKIQLNEITSATSNSAVAINGDDEMVIKIRGEATAVKNISTASIRISLKILDSDKYVLKNVDTNGLSFQFIANKVYYLVLKNNTPSLVRTTLRIGETTEVTLNQAVNNTSVKGDYFYQFTSNSEGYHSINLLSPSNHDLKIYDTNGGVVSATSTTIGVGVSHKTYLSAGQTIYFGYENADSAILKFTITLSTDIFTWYQDGVKINGDTIYLKQGQAVTISVKTGNSAISYTNLSMVNSSSCSLGAGGRLIVHPEAFPTSTSDQPHSIAIAGSNNVYLLKIYIMANVSFTISKLETNNANVGFNWICTLPKASDKFVAKGNIIFANGTRVPFQTPEISGGTTLTGVLVFDKTIFNSLSRKQVDVEINEITYYQFRSGLPYYPIPMTNSYLENVTKNQESLTCPSIINMATMFNGGSGTTNDPFKISNERHLQTIQYCTTVYYDPGAIDVISYHFVVTNDIALSQNWKPIEAPLRGGSLKSDGITLRQISGINISETKGSKDIGFFREIYTGEIAYLRFVVNINVTGENSNMIGVGGVAGYSAGRIERSYVNGYITVNSRNSYTGGFAGSTTGTFVLCENNATVTSYGYVGGIVGQGVGASFISCYNTGIAQLRNNYLVLLSSDADNRAVGGIAGVAFGSILDDSYSEGIVAYLADAKNKDKKLCPKIGKLVGWSFNTTYPESSGYHSVLDTGNLDTWTEGFIFTTTYNQMKYAKGTDVGYEGN